MQVVENVAVYFYGQVTGTVQLESERAAVCLRGDAVGEGTDAGCLYLFFIGGDGHFRFAVEVEITQGSQFHVMPGSFTSSTLTE